MKRANPRFAPYITTPFAVAINAAFLALVLSAALVGEKNLVFSLSVGALLFFNGVMHLVTTIRRKRYMPGLISSLLLYFPFSVTAFGLYSSAGLISLQGMGLAVLLGLLYQAIPATILLATRWTRTRTT